MFDDELNIESRTYMKSSDLHLFSLSFEREFLIKI